MAAQPEYQEDFKCGRVMLKPNWMPTLTCPTSSLASSRVPQRLSTRLSPSRPGTEHQHQQARLHQTSRRARASFGLPAIKHSFRFCPDRRLLSHGKVQLRFIPGEILHLWKLQVSCMQWRLQGGLPQTSSLRADLLPSLLCSDVHWLWPSCSSVHWLQLDLGTL